MSACVSPPQDRVSHMVEVAAIIAQAASTAFPPFWKIIAPAVAASGLPVTAIQWRPCSGGFSVFAPLGCAATSSVTIAAANNPSLILTCISATFPMVLIPYGLLTAWNAQGNALR